MIDGQDPSMHSGSPDPFQKYAGDFNNAKTHELTQEVQALEGQPAEDYFALLQGVANAQGYSEMANSIQAVANTCRGTLLRGNFEPVVTAWRDGQPSNSQSAEQYAREYIASGLGRMFSDLKSFETGQEMRRKDGQGTSTIADLRVGNDLDKELFVAFARILARDPAGIDSAMPRNDDVTDIAHMGITPEDIERGIVTEDGRPDQIVRFQTTSVDSVVPGFDFEIWRHNSAGYIRGDGSDLHKIYLQKH